MGILRILLVAAVGGVGRARVPAGGARAVSLTLPPMHARRYSPPGAEPERVIEEIESIIGLDCTNILRVGGWGGRGRAWLGGA